MYIIFSLLILSDTIKKPNHHHHHTEFSYIFPMIQLLLLYVFMVRVFFKPSSFYFFQLSLFYLLSVTGSNSDCHILVPVFSHFSLILSTWENTKHNSKSVSHQIRSQDDKWYCVCEDSCSRLCISGKNIQFSFENLLYTSSYFRQMGISCLLQSKCYKQN